MLEVLSFKAKIVIKSHQRVESLQGIMLVRISQLRECLQCRPLNYFASLYRRVQKNMMNMDQMLNMLEIESCVKVSFTQVVRLSTPMQAICGASGTRTESCVPEYGPSPK